LKKITDVLKFVQNNSCDFVILHSLFISLKVISKINRPIIWNSWGWDIYSDVDSPEKKAVPLPLYKAQTRKYVRSHLSIKAKLKKFFSFYYSWSYKRKLKRIEYVSTVFPEEYWYVKKVKESLKFFPFRYIEPFRKETEPEKALDLNERCILLGNSCDLTNNHMDILSLLEAKKEKMTVIMPISYPIGMEQYRKDLLKFTESLHYVKVRVLLDFMPYEKYCDLISRCSCAIFGHIRQQAAGNISSMLKAGAKVFLYEESFAYKHYSSLGCKVFSIENEIDSRNFFDYYEEDLRKRNREIIINDEDPVLYMRELQAFFDKLQLDKASSFL